MKKIKKVLSLILVAALLMFLAACSSDKSNNIAPTAPVQKPVTLTTVSMMGGTDPNAANYQAIITQFMKDNSYITIEDDSQSSTQNWKTKIAADFSVGNEPDVIQFFTDANASDVLATDKFITIDEIKAVYPDYAKDILPADLAAAANPDGVSRAVPTTGYWEGLFCNKDLFDKYGLELPDTWDKLLTAIKTFKANDIVPISVSLNEVPHYWVEFLLFAAAGVDGYTQIPATAPADWCAGLSMFKTLRDLGAFPDDTDTINNDSAGNMFMTKQAAMQLDGSWFLNGIPDQTNTVLCPFPVIPGGKAPAGFMVAGISSGFYITKKAWNDPDKRDAAVKFVMANTSKEAIQTYWGGSGQAAAAVTPLGNMTPLQLSGVQYIQSATAIRAATDSRISAEAFSTLIAGIVDVSTGEKTPEQLINEVLAVNEK